MPYYAVIRYTYEVADQKYVGSRITFGTNSSDKWVADRDTEYYEEGDKVAIYYHPDRPDFATLETELPFTTFVNLLGFSIVAFFALWIFTQVIFCEYSIGNLCVLR